VALKKTGAKALRPAPGKSVLQLLSAAVGPLVASDDGHASVAVDDLSTGQAASYGGTREYDTASIVKVDILSTLLYQAQQENRRLSETEQELATTMIENSDNGAASYLYDDDGGASGIDAANQAFGLTETTVGTNGAWGLTTTTADDQIRLLRLVFTTPSVLSPDSQGYIQSLMGQVEPDQQWGVPAAADSGTPFEVKNGWLPNPALWEINSIGEITHDGQSMLIAVLSSDNETEDDGISLVQDLAVRAADALARPR
jgi:beta-lactamase class A